MRMVFRVSTEGKERYPAPPFVAVVNHASNLDLPVMACAITGPAYFLAKAELFAVPVLGWWLRSVGGIPLARGEGDEGALGAAIAALRGGGAVFVAPEGTRKHEGEGRARPRSGFVRLAQTVGCPVVPVAVAGTREAMPPGKRLPRPRKLRIRVGDPIRLAPVEACEANLPVLRRQAQEVMGIVYSMKAELEAGQR